MKTHIIQPETHDDLISVLDMISWSKSPRVVLVLPGIQNIIHSRVDLIRLHRKAGQQGAMLSLVTRSRETIELAAEVGIPVFPTVQKANAAPLRKNWTGILKQPDDRVRHSKEELKSNAVSFKPKDLPDWLRITFFLLGVIAVFALAFLFIPRAEVEVRSTRSQQVLDLEIKASTSFAAPDMAGNIPLFSTAVTVETQRQIRTTGAQKVPKTFASCEVEFTNLQSEPVEVPAGTVVLTMDQPAIRFATTRDVTVAGGVGSLSNVESLALQPGEQGNVGAGKVSAIEGVIGVDLSVANAEACSGGTDELSPVGTDSDLAILRANVRDQLITSAEETLTAQMNDEIVVFNQTDPEIEILNMELQPGLGVASEYLQLTEEAIVLVTYYRDEDIQKAITLSMDAILEPEKKGLDNSLIYKMVSNPVGSKEPYRWNVHAVREVTQRIDPGEIALRLRGLNLEAAKEFINQQPGTTADSTISIYPGWWRYMPYLSFQIEVKTP